MFTLVHGASVTSLVLVFGLAFCALAAQSAASTEPNGFVDDSTIKIKTPEDIQRLREALIRYTWGNAGWPSKKMPDVKTNVACPIKGLVNFQRCDSLVVPVKVNATVTNTSVAWHLLPKGTPNRRLVIFNPGHVMDFNDPNYTCDARTIDALLAKGFSVVAMLMPRNANGAVHPHDNLFLYKFTDGSAFKIFFEPIAAYLNYLRTRFREDAFPQYTEYDMVGLSGGGWTSTVYPAMDPTITISIPVAGTMPLYLRDRNYGHDLEQYQQGFYSIAGYPDLYVMGAFGKGRKQIQILNRRDDCCFGERQHKFSMPWETAIRDYEDRVKATMKKMGADGQYRLIIDDVAKKHEISIFAQDEVILPALLKTPQP